MVQIILDFETSGLNPYHDDIIEIGAKVVGSDNYFQCLVRPKSNQMISDKITEITGITNRLLRAEGIQWLQAYNDFYNWLIETLDKEDTNAIVCHNGTTFDFIFLKRALNDMKQSGSIPNIDLIDEYKIEMIDTLLLSRRLIPGRYQYSQPSLCKTFNIEVEGAHRAMNDVICLEQLYNQLLESFQKENQDNSIQLLQDYIKLRI